MEVKRHQLIQRGTQLAFLLRHDRDYQFDEHGWRCVEDLITNHGYTMEEFCEIVETNKQRYEFSTDMARIRARQGHSIHVDVELVETEPAAVLYHGTAESTLDAIMASGIQRMNWLYMHLSSTRETATKVGRTAARPVLLTYYVLKDENTPRADKVVFAAALAYLVLPIDLISAKRFPVFGWLDELASVSIAYKRVAKHITPEIEQKADAQLDKWFPQAN